MKKIISYIKSGQFFQVAYNEEEILRHNFSHDTHVIFGLCAKLATGVEWSQVILSSSFVARIFLLHDLWDLELNASNGD